MNRLFVVLFSAMLTLGAGNAFGQAAYVHSMTGTATATTGTGPGATTRPLKIGDLIESGTTVSTGAKSDAVIKFEDGQLMVLSESTSFRIVDYRYNKQRVAQSSAIFSLLQGGLRYVSGVIGSTNRNNFRMTAGTATIGIRGSDGIVQYNSLTQAVMVAVLAGALTLDTSAGAAIIGPGQFSSVAQGQTPTAPTATNVAVTNAIAGLRVRNIPLNNVVVLRDSAAAAVAVANAAILANQAKTNPLLQAQADAAQKVAEDALATAIASAITAFNEAIAGGAVAAPTPAPPPLTGVTGTATDPSLTIEGVTITPTGDSGSGSGGGTPCSVSCN